jgi:Polysaccharide biosynthesis enzyme WcbI
MYLRINNGKTLQGPLGDYHNQTFLECWRNGLSIADAIELHYSIDYNCESYGNIPEISLTELKTREKDCDIKISDFIEQRQHIHRLFFTFNHPTVKVLLHAGRQLLERAGIDTEQMPYSENSEPLGILQPPLNPWVAKKYDFKVEKGTPWTGLEVCQANGKYLSTGKRSIYNEAQLVKLFFKIYSDSQNRIIDLRTT